MSATITPSTITLHPKKLLLTKWTAAKPINKDKHLIVTKVLTPEPSTGQTDVKIETIEIQAVFSKKTRVFAWRDLQNELLWKRGWV